MSMDYDIGEAISTEEGMIDMEGTNAQGFIMVVDIKNSSPGLIQESAVITSFVFSTPSPVRRSTITQVLTPLQASQSMLRKKRKYLKYNSFTKVGIGDKREKSPGSFASVDANVRAIKARFSCLLVTCTVLTLSFLSSRVKKKTIDFQTK